MLTIKQSNNLAINNEAIYLIYMDLLLLIGLTLLLGQVGARLLRLIKIPQVVGYILMGVLLGKSVLDWIQPETLTAVTSIALGLIGYTIGTQLQLSQLKKMGKSILIISFLEAFSAFLLVAVAIWLLTGKVYVGLIFGALACATAPAATVDVLEEYRCRGPFTTMVYAVVGIDDGIALIIYGIASSFAKMLYQPEVDVGLLVSLLEPVRELGGSIVLGIILGYIFSRLLQYFKLPGERLSVTLAIVFAGCGLAQQFHLSLIMTNMVIGLMVGNLVPRDTRRLNEIITGFTPPVYILFFALVGSRLDVKLLPIMGLLGIVYIVARAIGKFGGSYLGARISNAPDTVRKYLGLALFSQAGVAIGLAIAASSDFAAHGPEGAAFGNLIINTITATTFVVQLIGPSFTKMAVFKAGEAQDVYK
ncbi:MAG: cation:proton antiporter [Candidatus Hatepunaea meridiana]|nr:cation:proton antiporter [Candidatus Hatepunaea meridiana]